MDLGLWVLGWVVAAAVCSLYRKPRTQRLRPKA